MNTIKLNRAGWAHQSQDVTDGAVSAAQSSYCIYVQLLPEAAGGLLSKYQCFKLLHFLCSESQIHTTRFKLQQQIHHLKIERSVSYITINKSELNLNAHF